MDYFEIRIPKPSRRWLRFSLRTLLVVLTILGVWLGVNMVEARRQSKAVLALRNAGATVMYGGESPALLAPLRTFLGKDFARPVIAVRMEGTQFGDSDLKWLEELPDVEALSLTNALITDKGLQHIRGLSKLKRINLMHTQVTDAGLQHFLTLDELTDVNLRGTKVSVEAVKNFVAVSSNVEVEHHFLD